MKPGSRDLLLLLTSMVLASVPVGYLQVVLPLYLNRAGLEPSVIGLLYSLSGLVTAGLVAFSGTLADRFGRRGFLIWGTALPICSYLIFAATTDPRWLVLASVIGGVGLANGAAGALTIASFDAMLAEHTPPPRRTRVFAGLRRCGAWRWASAHCAPVCQSSYARRGQNWAISRSTARRSSR